MALAGLTTTATPEIKNEGGEGGDGRIRFISPDLHVTSTGVFTPEPVRPDLGAWQAPDGAVSVGAGEVLRFHTDGYDVFSFTNLSIAEGGTLTAIGSRPLIMQSEGDCVIDGTIDVSGGDGVPGQNLQASGGGGAGGGAVRISCARIRVSSTGRVLSNGGAGGHANVANAGFYRGTGGIGIAGGNDGGATGQPGFGVGEDGLGPSGGTGGTQPDDETLPPGAGGGGYGSPGEMGRCDALQGQCETVGGQAYGDAELTELLGGSGGGGGVNPPGQYEGAAGGGSGGSIHLQANSIWLAGTLSAVGGLGGLDDQSVGCDMGNTQSIFDAVINPYSINWDDNNGGTISDGGGDMYDGGNILSTSQNGNRIQPYTDNMDERRGTNHFGPDSYYMMDRLSAGMVLASTNTADSDMSFYISGNLGADGGGQHIQGEFTDGRLRAFYTMTCNGHGNDASVNHLFVFDQTRSPNAVHFYNPNTDSDEDGMHGIGPGSPFVYVLYSSNRGTGHCHTDAEHRVVFDALVSALMCTSGGENVNDGGRGGDGRIKIESPSFDRAPTALVTPAAGSVPELRPYIGGSLQIASGETVSFNTDGYTVFTFENLTIANGGMLTATGSRPFYVEVAGPCAIEGMIRLSGGAGQNGRDGGASGGGGAGGGAVKVSCGTVLTVALSGQIVADGGDGGCACGSDTDIGAGGGGVSGGYDGGSGKVYDLQGDVHGGDGFGPGGGQGGVWVADRTPPGGGGGGYAVTGYDGHCDAIAGDTLLSCFESGGVPYGDVELDDFQGGSGGGGGSDGPNDLEGVGGGGAGGAIWLMAPEVTVQGVVRAVGGRGGSDDTDHEVGGNNDGGDGALGRIKVEADVFHVAHTATIVPLPGSRPSPVPWQAPAADFVIDTEFTVNTDYYTSFVFTSLTVTESGRVTAVGSRPLRMDVSQTCTIDGIIDVSGGAGSPGQDLVGGAGGGAGGGAVKLTCNNAIISPTGRISADGGAGGPANLGEPGDQRGLGGVGRAGGRFGGRGTSHFERRCVVNTLSCPTPRGGNGQGTGGGVGGSWLDNVPAEAAAPVDGCIIDSDGSNFIMAAVGSPYNINWDDNNGGTISDGGSDMYDGGNYLCTSYCGGNDANRLRPYTDDFVTVESACFGGGDGAMYMMDQLSSGMVLLSQNTGSDEMTFYVKGNLGADGGGQHVPDSFEEGRWKGYMTMTCNGHGNDPSVVS